MVALGEFNLEEGVTAAFKRLGAWWQFNSKLVDQENGRKRKMVVPQRVEDLPEQIKVLRIRGPEDNEAPRPRTRTPEELGFVGFCVEPEPTKVVRPVAPSETTWLQRLERNLQTTEQPQDDGTNNNNNDKNTEMSRLQASVLQSMRDNGTSARKAMREVNALLGN